MAYNGNNCVTDFENTGPSQCIDNLGYDAKLILTERDFEIDTEADAILEATYTEAINDQVMWPLPQFAGVEDNSEDDVEQTFDTGISIHVREGKYGGTGMIQVAICDLPKLRSFNNASLRAFIVTSDGKIWGTSPDGAKFRGFELSKFKVSLLKNSSGSEARMVHISYQFKNPTEMGDYPAIPELTWDPLQLEGVFDVDVAVDSSTSGSVVVSVVGNCDGGAITGLVEGDFTMVDSGGDTVLSADDFADNGDGTYTFTFTTPVLPDETYTVDLAAPNAQTTGGYESTASDSFVISS